MDPIFRMLRYSENFQKNTTANHAIMTLCQNLNLVATLPIDRVAELSLTNSMTISRIVRKLGYQNYGEFKKAAKESTDRYYYQNRSIPICKLNEKDPAEAFLDYMEEMLVAMRNPEILSEIEPACKKLHEKKVIHYYGSQMHNIAITMLLHDLIVDGKEVHPYCETVSIEADLELLGKDSLVLLAPNQYDMEVDLTRKIVDRTKKEKVELMLLCEMDHELLNYTTGPNLCYPGDHTSANVLFSQFLMNMVTMTYRKMYLDQ